MTRDEGVKRLRERANGEGFRFTEHSVDGRVTAVWIEHVARPLWRVTGDSWADAIRKLEAGEPDAR